MKSKNPVAKYWDYSFCIHSNTDWLLFPVHTSHTSNLWCPTFPTETAKRWSLMLSHSNCLAHKEAGRDWSFKYFSHHHLRPEGLQSTQLLMSELTLFYQRAACMLLLLERHGVSYLASEKGPEKRVLIPDLTAQ